MQNMASFFYLFQLTFASSVAVVGDAETVRFITYLLDNLESLAVFAEI